MTSLPDRLWLVGMVADPTNGNVMPRERQIPVCRAPAVRERPKEDRVTVTSLPITLPEPTTKAASPVIERSNAQVGETTAKTAEKAEETR